MNVPLQFCSTSGPLPLSLRGETLSESTCEIARDHQWQVRAGHPPLSPAIP